MNSHHCPHPLVEVCEILLQLQFGTDNVPGLYGLQETTQEHVMQTDQHVHWVVVDLDYVHLLQVLDTLPGDGAVF